MPTYLDGGLDYNTPGTITLPSQSFSPLLVRLTASGTYTLQLDASTRLSPGARFDVIQYAPGSQLAITTSGVSILGNFAPSAAAFTRYEFTYVAANVWRIDTVLDRSSTVVRHYPIFDGTASALWAYTGVGLVAAGSGGATTLVCPIGPFRSDEMISQIAVSIKPPSGHGSFLPANMPKWRLYAGGSGSLGPPYAFGLDPSSSVAAYEAAHAITGSFSPVSADNSFWLEIDNETGTHAILSGLRIYDIAATVSIVQ